MNPIPARVRIKQAAVLSILLHSAAWLLLSSHPPQRPRAAPVLIVVLRRPPLPTPQAFPPEPPAAASVPVRPVPLRALKQPRARANPESPTPSAPPPAVTPPVLQPASRPPASEAGPGGAPAGAGTVALPGPGSSGGDSAASGPVGGPAPAPAPVHRAVCPQSAVSYPAEARRRGLEGEVTARLLVREDGTIADATIVHSAGAVLDEAVLEAVRTLRCSPARQGARAISANLPYTVRFVLEDD